MKVARGSNLVGMSMLSPDACPLSLLRNKKKLCSSVFKRLRRFSQLLAVAKKIYLHVHFGWILFMKTKNLYHVLTYINL